jgi:hypothetical protein
MTIQQIDEFGIFNLTRSIGDKSSTDWIGVPNSLAAMLMNSFCILQCTFIAHLIFHLLF